MDKNENMSEEEKVVCEDCHREVKWCDECGKDFKFGDKVFCLEYGQYHFCSLECQEDFIEQQVEDGY